MSPSVQGLGVGDILQIGSSLEHVSHMMGPSSAAQGLFWEGSLTRCYLWLEVVGFVCFLLLNVAFSSFTGNLADIRQCFSLCIQ